MHRMLVFSPVSTFLNRLVGGIFVTGSTTWLSLAEDRTAYGSRGVGITCSVEFERGGPLAK